MDTPSRTTNLDLSLLQCITKTQTNTFTFYFGVILCLILGTFNGEFHTIPRESSFLLCGTLSKKGSIAMYTQSHIVRNQYEH